MRLTLCFLLCAINGAFADDWCSLKGHERWVLALALSPDGKDLASGSDDHTLRLWEIEKGEASKVLKRFDCAVSALSFDPKGKWLAVGTWNGDLMICDPLTGKVIREFSEHRETITALAFDPSGRYLASGSADDRLIIWDAKTGDDLLTMHQGNEYDVTTLAFSRDGERIVTGDGENQLKVWDTSSGDEIETLGGHAEPVTCVVFDPNGNVISGSWDDTIFIRRAEGDLRLKGHNGDITGLAINQKGTRIISSSEDKTVKIWNAKTGELESSMSGHSESVRSLAVSADGSRIFSGSKGVIHFWTIGTPGPATKD